MTTDNSKVSEPASPKRTNDKENRKVSLRYKHNAAGEVKQLVFVVVCIFWRRFVLLNKRHFHRSIKYAKSVSNKYRI